MTRAEIRAALIAVDPAIRHYRSMKASGNYTYWEETRLLNLCMDNHHAEGWAFVVHRYTKDENDALAAQLFSALDNDDRITVIYQVDHEIETGYIHHIFDCEAV